MFVSFTAFQFWQKGPTLTKSAISAYVGREEKYINMLQLNIPLSGRNEHSLLYKAELNLSL